MSYDYRAAMYEDIMGTLGVYSHLFIPYVTDGMLDADGVMDELREALAVDDSVTGNGSGSFTFSSKEAGEYVGENWDLLVEAVDTFGIEIPRSVESADAIIRYSLLDSVLLEVIRDVEKGYRRPKWLQKMLDKSKEEDSKEQEKAI